MKYTFYTALIAAAFTVVACGEKKAEEATPAPVEAPAPAPVAEPAPAPTPAPAPAAEPAPAETPK